MRQAKRDVEAIGFDPDTGLLLPNDGNGAGNRKSVTFRTIRKSPEKRPETPDSEPSESSEKSSKPVKVADSLSVEIDAKLNNISIKGNEAVSFRTFADC